MSGAADIAGAPVVIDIAAGCIRTGVCAGAVAAMGAAIIAGTAHAAFESVHNGKQRPALQRLPAAHSTSLVQLNEMMLALASSP